MDALCLSKCEVVLLVGGAVVGLILFFLGYCRGRIDEYKDTFRCGDDFKGGEE